MSAIAYLIEGGVQKPLPASRWEELLTVERDAEEWEWRLLDAQDRALGNLDGVEGGSLELNVNSTTRLAGDFSWSGPASAVPYWRDYRIQPTYRATLRKGSQIIIPMGVCLATMPGKTVSSGYVDASVRLFDKTLVLERAKLPAMYAVSAGTQVIPLVRQLLENHGLPRHAITDSGSTLRTNLAWDIGTSIKSVVNDLLQAAGYYGIWPDGLGVMRSSPYVEPGSRPFEWAFTDKNGTAVHEDAIEHEEDDHDVPNRVTVSSRGDGYDFELVAVRTLDQISPGHPFSHAKTGFWVDRNESGVDITNTAALIAYADRLLREGVDVTSNITLTHRPLPLAGHDRVSVDSSGIVAPSATVQSMRIDCAPGEDWTTTVRESA